METSCVIETMNASLRIFDDIKLMPDDFYINLYQFISISSKSVVIELISILTFFQIIPFSFVNFVCYY